MGETRKARQGGRGRCQLIGMVHLPALPGAPLAKLPMPTIIETAVREASMLIEAGFDAVMVENYGDHPFWADTTPPETAAAMALVAEHVVRRVKCPVGVNVLRNDGAAALAAAAVSGASFIRVNVFSGVMATDQGMLTGRAAEIVRRRALLCGSRRNAVRIFADVHVKHAVAISQPDLAQAARDTAYRALADGLIVSGAATGQATDIDDVRCVTQAVADRPVWVGSGVTPQHAAALAEIADGLIVGTCLKRGGRTESTLDGRRVRAFVRAARHE